MEELIEEMKGVAAAGAISPAEGYKNLNNPWIARSGLQKAIRRGRVDEALMCGANLMTADPAKAWRALATIIVEDVGFVDLDLLAFSTVAPLVAVQKLVGKPSDLFRGMVIRACATPVKTRSACELSLGADKDPETPWKYLEQLTDDHLLTVVAGPAGLSQQYAATCVAKQRCRKDKSGKLQAQVLQIMMDALGTGSAARAAMMSFERPIDSMNMAIWPLLSHGYDKTEDELLDVMPPSPQIGGVMAAAWDMHTMQGKKAIKAFHTSLVKKGNLVMQALSAKSEDVVKGLGSIIFIVEGGQVGPHRLSSVKLQDLKDYQDKHFSAAWGCPAELFEPVRQTVLENFDLLNSKREWAVKS